MYDICSLDQGHAIAVGYNGAKLETIDGGYTWKSGYIVADNTIERLDGIYFLTPKLGWVVGVGGFVATTIDAGATWHLVNNGIADIWLRDVWFVNDSTGWVVGQNGNVLKTMDGGNSWVNQTGFPTNKIVYVIQMFNENEGVIGGQDKNLYYTNDGGTTWVPATSPVAAADDINGMYFIDPAHGWAVGEKGTIVFSSDKGATWTKQTSGATLELEDVYFRNMNDGWAVGQNGLILATTNGGTTWAVQGAGVTGKTLAGIAPRHGSILWAAGFEGTLLKYVDDSYVTKSQIKMNEIFYNAFRNTELECQYIELYNAGAEVEYLDGKVICRLSKGDIDYVTYIWQFPGNGMDYPIQPGEYKIVTPDAKSYTDLDLSNADFEYFVTGEFISYDNPAVPNLINLINLADPTKKSEFLINYRGDVIAFASGKDIYWLDGLDIETVIDGVEYDSQESSSQSLNDLVDAGHAVGPTANYLGRSIERKEPGLDT
ncbi:MAG: YCF48-related protein, partial [bacterium]|nr:YCF48-related protein [bacterium]